MRIHALEATGGFTYSEMGQYVAKPGAPASALAPGGGTSDRQFAVIDPETKQPQSNGARNVWVTETALATALNSTYMASQLSLFAIIVGVALLLAGFGFAILSIGGARSGTRDHLPVPSQAGREARREGGTRRLATTPPRNHIPPPPAAGWLRRI